jgi:ATP-binding cassette subfamily B protein/subfamily B ATP-binding cassette protein MsbA
LARSAPSLLRRLGWRRLGQFLEPFTSVSPAARLIRRSARQQWRLLTVNIATNLLSSISEGGTLGVIFLAVSLISSPNPDHWSRLPVVAQAIRLPVVGNVLQEGINSSSGQGILFVLLIGFALILQVIVALTMYLNSVSAGIIGNRLSAQISTLLHHRTLSFTFSCACRFRVGDLLNYIQTGGSAVSTQISLTNTLLTNLIQLLIYLFILIAISPWLLLVAACMAAFMGALQKQVLPRLRHTSEVMTMIGVEMGSRVTENIQGLRLIHSSGELKNASQSLDSLFQQWLRQADRLSYITNLITPISTILPIFAIAVISTLSLALLHDRQSGVIPSLITFVLALQRMNSRLNTINTIAVGYANNSAAVSRLNAILDDRDKQFVRTGGFPFKTFDREIRLDKVTLRYGPNLAASLDSIDLVIPKGQTIALIGPSGAGKSSLADLLVGLYEPTSGSIRIDGQNLNQMDLATWQQRIGVVSQDTFLMNTTIAGNIAYGQPAATREQIEAAAISAQAANFIHDLPEGYDTLIGERGYRLSGGQRQRISLARAILRNPDLLILDEATSALDTQSERLVQQAIEQFEGHNTVLVIAHRLSTIVGADLICVMDRGQIIERGRHADLITAGGLYTQLWQLQASESPLNIRN